MRSASVKRASIHGDPDLHPASRSDGQDTGDAGEIGVLHATELTPDADGTSTSDDPTMDSSRC